MPRFLAILLFLAGSVAASPAVAQTRAAAPDAPPPLLHCFTPGPYIVFFAPGSARLQPAAVEILDDMVKDFRSPCGGGSLVIAGHADRSGRSSRNLVLSRRRAAAVARYLETHGIPRREVSVLAFGEGRPLDDAKNGLHERENRRVEITVGPAHE